MLSSFSHIPPGPVHLVRFIPQLVLPSFLLYASSKLGLKVPLAWLLPAVALATPGLYKALIWYKLWTVTRAAEKLGARVVPIVQRSSKELIQHAAKALKQGYPGILDEFAEGYGTVFGLRVLTETRIVTFEPEHVKAILASQFETFDKGHIFKSHMHSLFGNGVFNSDGDLWRFHRTLSRPFFSRERVNDHPNLLFTADKALRIASARLSEGHAFDLQDLAMRYTLDISTQFLLGNSVHSLDGGLAYPHSNSLPSSSAQLDKDPANAFGVALSEGTYLSADRSKYGAHWPLAEFWKDEVKARREVIDAFIEPHLKRVLKSVGEKRAPGSIDQADVEDQTLIECLARQAPDETLIKDELANFLIAGRDTTAATITFSVYMLSRYPVIAERVRKDVLSRLRGDEQPTAEDVKEMKYLRAFINEVLRLYPPVPYDSRMSNKATLWPSPTPGGKPSYIPAKSKILYSMWYMHRSTELWGPDALEFDPDRFLDDRLHKYLTPNPYMFIPFNAGPRICLGMQFAYNMSSIFLIRLLQRFENIRLALDAQPPGSLPPAEWATEDRPLDPRKAEERVSPKTSINMSVKGGLWVRMDEIKLEDQDDDFEFISLSKSRRL